jgi:hypothetical protein
MSEMKLSVKIPKKLADLSEMGGFYYVRTKEKRLETRVAFPSSDGEKGQP